MYDTTVWMLALVSSIDGFLIAAVAGADPRRRGRTSSLTLPLMFAFAAMIAVWGSYECGSVIKFSQAGAATCFASMPLAAVGLRSIRQAISRQAASGTPESTGNGLGVVSLLSAIIACNVDTLCIGPAMVAGGIPLAEILLVFGATTGIASTIGTLAGKRSSLRATWQTDCFAGLVLVLLSVALAA